MNTKLIVSIAIAGIVLVGGYLIFFTKDASLLESAQTQEPRSQSPSVITLRLNAQNNSGETGTAKLVEKDGKVVVSLLFAGAPKDVIQPAHIHVGSCPDVGAVKYPLTFPVNGISETILDISFADLRAGLPLAINVHKSAAEAKIYVACADLVSNRTE